MIAKLTNSTIIVNPTVKGTINTDKHTHPAP